MRRFILIALAFGLMLVFPAIVRAQCACGGKCGSTTKAVLPKVETKTVVPQPAKAEPKKEKVKEEPPADGDYYTLQLPCKCGAVYIYYPGSCGCFDKENYPDLDKALRKLYKMAYDMGKGKQSKKMLGKYENATLECGCTLKVYKPDSCGCLSKKYPDLAKQLEVVYNVAQKHKEKKE